MALGVPRHISEMEMEKAFQMGCTLYFGFIYIYSFVNTVFHIHEKRKKKDE
jgi:flagellar biosynthesis protein FliP